MAPTARNGDVTEDQCVDIAIGELLMHGPKNGSRTAGTVVVDADPP